MNGEKNAGIIIKQSDFGEGHRMVWVFTEKYGIIKAVAHGAEKLKSKSGAATQFLSYCDFVFYEGGDIWNINSVTAKDTFWPIQEDIKKLALCTYFADLIYFTLDLYNPDTNIMRLFLNTLYACAYRSVPCEILKLTFETKLMYAAGYLPRPDVCSGCGQTDGAAFFDLRSGAVLCRDCAKGNEARIDETAYKVLYYLVFCDMKKMFSLRLPEEGVRILAPLIEKYTASVLDRPIKSLDYYKGISKNLP